MCIVPDKEKGFSKALETEKGKNVLKKTHTTVHVDELPSCNIAETTHATITLYPHTIRSMMQHNRQMQL